MPKVLRTKSVPERGKDWAFPTLGQLSRESFHQQSLRLYTIYFIKIISTVDQPKRVMDPFL